MFDLLPCLQNEYKQIIVLQLKKKFCNLLVLEAEQFFNCEGKKQPKKISTAINTSVKMRKSHGVLLAYASRKKQTSQ